MNFSRMTRLSLVLMLTAAGGCGNTPTKSGVPWWPQGPGNPQGSESATSQSSASSTAQETAKPVAQAAPAPQAAPVPQAAPAPQAGATAAAASVSQANSTAVATAAAPGSAAQATRYGDLLFLSGQSAANAGDIARQTHAVMQQIDAILGSHRLTMANVVHVTVQLASIKDLQAMDAAYATHFPSTFPARTVAEVAHLPGDALVQITVVAGR